MCVCVGECVGECVGVCVRAHVCEGFAMGQADFASATETDCGVPHSLSAVSPCPRRENEENWAGQGSELVEGAALVGPQEARRCPSGLPVSPGALPFGQDLGVSGAGLPLRGPRPPFSSASPLGLWVPSQARLPSPVSPEFTHLQCRGAHSQGRPA